MFMMCFVAYLGIRVCGYVVCVLLGFVLYFENSWKLIVVLLDC